MNFDKVIKERHSVRSFKKTKKPDYKKIIEIIEAGTLAPLAGNMFSIKYLVVADKEKIGKIAEACQQDFVGEVAFLIVVCSDRKPLDKHYYERGKIYSRQQAGASVENMLLKATELGLASCWVGAFSDETIRHILNIPDDIELEAVLPIGYELGKKKQLPKADLDRAPAPI